MSDPKLLNPALKAPKVCNALLLETLKSNQALNSKQIRFGACGFRIVV